MLRCAHSLLLLYQLVLRRQTSEVLGRGHLGVSHLPRRWKSNNLNRWLALINSSVTLMCRRLGSTHNWILKIQLWRRRWRCVRHHRTRLLSGCRRNRLNNTLSWSNLLLNEPSVVSSPKATTPAAESASLVAVVVSAAAVSPVAASSVAPVATSEPSPVAAATVRVEGLTGIVHAEYFKPFFGRLTKELCGRARQNGCS